MNPLTREGHLFGALFADPEIEALWSSDRFLAEFVAIEAALAEALAEAGVVSAAGGQGRGAGHRHLSAGRPRRLPPP